MVEMNSGGLVFSVSGRAEDKIFALGIFCCWARPSPALRGLADPLLPPTY